jgi:hypothetical protein
MESAESSAESSSAEAERTKRSGLAPIGGVLQVSKNLMEWKQNK